ncbi:hypothetical protein ACLOJK_022166 [Asimina triloba]
MASPSREIFGMSLSGCPFDNSLGGSHLDTQNNSLDDHHPTGLILGMMPNILHRWMIQSVDLVGLTHYIIFCGPLTPSLALLQFNFGLYRIIASSLYSGRSIFKDVDDHFNGVDHLIIRHIGTTRMMDDSSRPSLGQAKGIPPSLSQLIIQGHCQSAFLGGGAQEERAWSGWAPQGIAWGGGGTSTPIKVLLPTQYNSNSMQVTGEKQLRAGKFLPSICTWGPFISTTKWALLHHAHHDEQLPADVARLASSNYKSNSKG